MGGFRSFVATAANGEVAPEAATEAAAAMHSGSTQSGHPMISVAAEPWADS
jgi:hypothetical protein